MFENRAEAGRLLAKKLLPFRGEDTVVLAIPRGGVVVGRVIADYLECPLEVLVVRKLGAPGNSELAIGAVASGGIVYWDKRLVVLAGATEEYKNKELRIKNYELKERERLLGRWRSKIDVLGKTVILTDDGVATGATMLAVIRAVRPMKPRRIILAVPVIAFDSLEKIKREVDELVYIEAPPDFHAVGQFYTQFEQTSNAEVANLLTRNKNYQRKDNL